MTVEVPTLASPVLPPHKIATWKDSHGEQHHDLLDKRVRSCCMGCAVGVVVVELT